MLEKMYRRNAQKYGLTKIYRNYNDNSKRIKKIIEYKKKVKY